MNSRAAELGMENTHFVTPSGLDGVDAHGEGHFSTAYDMALLAREALKNETFRELCSSASYPVEFAEPVKQVTYTNHNKLLGWYEAVWGEDRIYRAGRPLPCFRGRAQRGSADRGDIECPDDWRITWLCWIMGFPR